MENLDLRDNALYKLDNFTPKLDDKAMNLTQLREQTKQYAQENLLNKDFTNKATNIIAQVSNKGLSKMMSEKAINKSVSNGFTTREHFIAINKLKEIFENSQLLNSYIDPRGKNNQTIIRRFNAILDKNTEAKLLVKESLDKDTNRIYTIELDSLEKRIDNVNRLSDSALSTAESKTSLTAEKQLELESNKTLLQDSKHSLDLATNIFKTYNTSKENNALFDKVIESARQRGVKFETSLSENAPWNAKGEFDKLANTARVKGNDSETILHELIHSVTHNAISNPQGLSKLQRQGYDELQSLFNQLKADERFNKEYALNSADELIAELSNTTFRHKLKSVSVDNQSLFYKIINAIARLFNINPLDSADKALKNSLYKLMSNGNLSKK